jgi:hypothetical protein
MLPCPGSGARRAILKVQELPMAPPVSQTHVRGDVERLKDAIAATFSASDADDLLTAASEEVADNITATFPNFVIWLQLEHPSTAKLRVIPEALLKQMADRYDRALEKHIDDVKELIDEEISTTFSGKALLKYIALAEHTKLTHLTIAPCLGGGDLIDTEVQHLKLYPNAFAVDTIVRDGGGTPNLTDPKPGQKPKPQTGGGWGVDVEVIFQRQSLEKKMAPETRPSQACRGEHPWIGSVSRDGSLVVNVARSNDQRARL